MNLHIDPSIEEGLIRIGLFVTLGLLIRRLSLKFPMQAYDNSAVKGFDGLFIMVALLVAIAVEELISPSLLLVLQNGAAWPDQAVTWVSQSATWVQVVVYLFLTDLFGYGIHRLMHTPWLWRIHAFHHSVESLNWVSGIRGSPWHMVLILLPGALVSAVFLLPHNPTAFMVVMVIDVASQHLNHSNLRLPMARQLEWLLVTPQMHFIHHSKEERLGKCNYGFYFSYWDRLFGTYVHAEEVADKGPLGLKEDYSKSSMFWGIQLHKRR